MPLSNSQGDSINNSSILLSFIVHLCMNYSKGPQQFLRENSYKLGRLEYNKDSVESNINPQKLIRHIRRGNDGLKGWSFSFRLK